MWPYLILLCVAVLAIVHFRHWRHWRRAAAEHAVCMKALSELQQHHREGEFAARAQMQTLFNSMVEGVLLLDEQGRVGLVNQSLERLFQLRLDVRGLSLVEAIRHPELVPLIERLKTTRQVVSVEIEVDNPPVHCVEVNAASVLDRDGRPQGTILVFHDLTRIRQLEDTRREFVANVSHELRTPLTLIKGYTETLLSGAKENPAVASRFLEKIERHTNRLSNLIEDLLTISRLESGQVTLKLEVVDFREFTSRIIEDLQAPALDKNIAISNELPPGLRARADLDRLQQVLVNLLDNAVKYGRLGGHVTVGGRELPDHRLQICVSDDGPGIPPEARSRIFERFFRVDKARSRDTGGTGLGLSIVKHIVQSHGGEVWLESELGRGTSFFFTLPGA